MQCAVGRILAGLLVVGSQSGCYDWIVMRPAEINHRTTSEIRVTTSEGTSKFWEATTRIEDGTLLVESVSRRPAEFTLSNVVAVERSKLNPATTGVALTWLAFVAFVGILFVPHMEFPGLKVQSAP